jgi:PAS domain S-box-containing protein
MSLARELRALQAELPPALEVVRVPAVLVDAAGRIRWLNAAGIALFGDLRGRRYTDLIAPEDMGVAQEAFARKILGAPSTDYRARIVGTSGETIDAEVSSVGLRSGKSVVGVFGLLKPVGREPRSRPPRFGSLTPRQYEVLRHLGEGYGTRDIAAEMGISEETVRNHVRGIFKVLRAHSRLEAVAIAHTDGLLD